MAITQYKILPYVHTATYKKFDIIVDQSVPRYYYSTQDSVGQQVEDYYSYPISSWSRVNDIVTLNYTKTGSGPNFSQGSLLVATGQTSTQIYYTGMAINADQSSLSYLSPGPDMTGSSLGQINTLINPCWTTGFYFIPSYSSNFEVKTNVLSTQFGDGYSQRQRNGLNPNVYSLNAVFDSRTDRETKAIINFIEDKAGVEPFKILNPSTLISSNPNIKYVAVDPKINTQSYNLNTVSAVFSQVFDS